MKLGLSMILNLKDEDGYDIKRYRAEHHSLEKAKEILKNAHKF